MSHCRRQGRWLFPCFRHCRILIMIAVIMGGAVSRAVRLACSFCMARVKVISAPIPLHSTTCLVDLFGSPQRGHSEWSWLPLKNLRLPTPHKPVACFKSHLFFPEGSRPIASSQASQFIYVITSLGVRLCFLCQYALVSGEKVYW
jgi:hypothetical protein